MLTSNMVSKLKRSGAAQMVVVALGLLLGACGGRVDDGGTAEDGETLDMEAPTEEGWVGFFRPRKSKIDFQPCEGDPALECGALKVPLDYKDQGCKSTEIWVARLPSTRKDGPKHGVLVLGPGGPGGSGIDSLSAMRPFFDAGPLRENFDIVSFDPRGVGRSNAVRCEVDMPQRPANPNDDVAVAAYFDEFGRRTAEACFAQNGVVARHMSTNNVARDVDVLRKALSEDEITFFGSSYGTQIGAIYANFFPKRVRAMVLDGALAPTFVDSLTERARDTASAAEQALVRLDQACRADAGCLLRGPGVIATLERVAARLDAAPVAVGGGQAPMTGDDVRFMAMGLLFSESVRWPLLVVALATASFGDDSILLSLLPLARTSDVYVSGRKAYLDAFTAVTCSDYGTRRDAADYLELARANAGASPHFGGLFFSVVHSAAFAAAQCSAWPEADVPRIEKVRGRVKTPVLIVGNDFDNATPIAWSQSLGKALGMEDHVLRYGGGGHTAYAVGVNCVDSAVNDYLITRKLPSSGSVCDAQALSFSFKAQNTADRLADLGNITSLP
ncbi:MAG: alpha/beta hydrolase [Polyangiaceae bacterium]|nr:alpha/beta hydrolase [Polyangiaceae bacterium]